ncbi:MAG: hypothetical protein FJ387_30130 [Verrucomicrobia bacterium]|nr:hypothetical protein [Verrucomicrobiota bacterium]
MNISNRTIGAWLAAAVWAAASCALAQDWPQWRGANRDGKAGRFNAPQTWPAELVQKWKVTVGQGDATPALVGNRLYVFARQEGNEVTLCLDAGTGRELWKAQYEALGATGPAGRHAGPRSSPAVAEGKVVTFGVRGALACLDAASGQVLWRKDDFAGAWPRFFTSSSPIVLGGVCIVQPGAPENGGVVAYGLATGNPKWQWTGDGPGYASPVACVSGSTQMVVAMTDKKVVGLQVADGKLLWETAFAPTGRAYNAATPIVLGQTIVCTGAGRGTRAWSLEAEGSSFVTKERWSNPDVAVQFNTPVVKNGLVFGLTQNNELFCLDERDGKTRWTAALGGRGGFGSVVDAGDVLLGLTPQAELLVFAPTGEEYKKLASYKVAGSETYAYPVASGNRVFIKDQDTVTLWTLD